ncbi:MAG: hypothetical protein AAGA00_07740 [Pseudomonadota bacterium]
MSVIAWFAAADIQALAPTARLYSNNHQIQNVAAPVVPSHPAHRTAKVQPEQLWQIGNTFPKNRQWQELNLAKHHYVW